jgi:hypothetical protein
MGTASRCQRTPPTHFEVHQLRATLTGVNRIQHEVARHGAYLLSLVLRGAALFVFVLTVYASYQSGRFATQFGISWSHDPAPWLVLAFGLTIAMVLGGVGQCLALLCAIYERQADPFVTTDPRVVAQHPVRAPVLIPSAARSVPPADFDSQSGRGWLWEQMSKERKLPWGK